MDRPLEESVQKSTGKSRARRGDRNKKKDRVVPYQDYSTKSATTKKGSSGPQPGQLLIHNLPLNVKESEFQTLFSQFGPVSSANLNFNSKGQSLGSGQVVFKFRKDALRAHSELNGQKLYGNTVSVVLLGDIKGEKEKPKDKKKDQKDKKSKNQKQNDKPVKEKQEKKEKNKEGGRKGKNISIDQLNKELEELSKNRETAKSTGSGDAEPAPEVEN